jgi:hypothetical protein
LRVGFPKLSLNATNYSIALRSFTLESGQQELERLARRRKERQDDLGDLNSSRRGSVDSQRSPTSSHQRPPQLSDVPEEEGTFAIGDDDDESENDGQTPGASTPTEQPSRVSRASSVSSSVDDAVPVQLRGMSEKARGKMPGNPFLSQPRFLLLTALSGYANLFPPEQYDEPEQLRGTVLHNRCLRANIRLD